MRDMDQVLHLRAVCTQEVSWGHSEKDQSNRVGVGGYCMLPEAEWSRSQVHRQEQWPRAQVRAQGQE